MLGELQEMSADQGGNIASACGQTKVCVMTFQRSLNQMFAAFAIRELTGKPVVLQQR
ncbi:hypothetical protein D3C81_1474620 [compost metagenome]